MATVLKVDEWKGASGFWYVADVHTWTGWRECADVLGAESLEDYKNILKNKYKATIHCDLYRNGEVFNVMFNWPQAEYKNAHQFKLDVNRIARKKGYMVE